MWLQSGTVYEGVVTSVRRYGAFVDIGDGRIGLLHISQISKERLAPGDIERLLPEGTRIKVKRHRVGKGCWQQPVVLRAKQARSPLRCFSAHVPITQHVCLHLIRGRYLGRTPEML